ncbi:hypothetical protein [Paludibacterium denitrificans]|uniref:hypothetical protein n=1 Tax=Paludibacterium denitrificans TaxID=2675226 RepID=UPI001E4D185F|nr:hypothetical protein [Paludibacterium denitrificans]
MNGVAIFLCDITGIAGEPWLAAGYDIVLVDPQHTRYMVERTTSGATVERIPLTILQAAQRLGEIVRGRHVVFVAGFPPCTDVAVSGARWFEDKRKADPHFQAKAALVAEQCRMVGELSGAPWLFENPVSVLSSIFGKPDHTFHPWHFTSLEPDDNYTKQTCLWVGGGFVMPDACPDASLGEPDNRIHACPPW